MDETSIIRAECEVGFHRFLVQVWPNRIEFTLSDGSTDPQAQDKIVYSPEVAAVEIDHHWLRRDHILLILNDQPPIILTPLSKAAVSGLHQAISSIIIPD